MGTAGVRGTRDPVPPAGQADRPTPAADTDRLGGRRGPQQWWHTDLGRRQERRRTAPGGSVRRGVASDLVHLSWLREAMERMRSAAEEQGRPVPALAPRVVLRLTDTPVTRSDRPVGEGTIDQGMADMGRGRRMVQNSRPSRTQVHHLSRRMNSAVHRRIRRRLRRQRHSRHPDSAAKSPGPTRSPNDGYAQPAPSAPTASSPPVNGTCALWGSGRRRPDRGPDVVHEQVHMAEFGERTVGKAFRPLRGGEIGLHGADPLSRDPGGLGLPPSPPRRLHTGAGLVSRRQRCSVSRPGR